MSFRVKNYFFSLDNGVKVTYFWPQVYWDDGWFGSPTRQAQGFRFELA